MSTIAFKKKRMLFLTTAFPLPLDNGGKIRTFHVIEALSKEYTIDLVCFNEPPFIDKRYIDELKEYCNEVIVIKKIFTNSKSKRTFIKNIAKSFIKRTPFIIEKFYDKEYSYALEGLLNKNKYSAVFFEHLSITSYRNMFKNVYCKSILSQQNCEYLILKRRLENESSLVKRAYLHYECKKLEKYEKKTCASFDKVIMLSEEDKKNIVTESYGKDNTSIVPIAVSCDYRKQNYNNTFMNLLFMGTMSWYPNEQGAFWFLENVWKYLQTEYEDKIKLYIVGKNPSNNIKKYEGKDVEVTGYVDDVNKYIEICDICIVPLFIGGGMRVKILECMAKGIPVISTSIGAEGIKCTNFEDIIIANTKDEFIRAIQELNRNHELYKRIVCNGKALVERNYSIDVIRNLLIESIV